MISKVTTGVCLTFLCGMTMVSCHRSTITHEDLQGAWILCRVEGENHFRTEHEWNDRVDDCIHYLIFSGDSVTSLQQPCFILEKGTYTLSGDTLKQAFEFFGEASKVELKDDLLRLTRREGFFQNTYIYRRTDTVDMRNLYGDPAHGIWHTPACFNGTRWKYTGRRFKRKMEPLISFPWAPPDTIDLCRSFMAEKTVFHIDQDAGRGMISFWCAAYNGFELSVVPVNGWSGDWGDSVYVYRRVR